MAVERKLDKMGEDPTYVILIEDASSPEGAASAIKNTINEKGKFDPQLKNVRAKLLQDGRAGVELYGPAEDCKRVVESWRDFAPRGGGDISVRSEQYGTQTAKDIPVLTDEPMSKAERAELGRLKQDLAKAQSELRKEKQEKDLLLSQYKGLETDANDLKAQLKIQKDIVGAVETNPVQAFLRYIRATSTKIASYDSTSSALIDRRDPESVAEMFSVGRMDARDYYRKILREANVTESLEDIESKLVLPKEQPELMEAFNYLEIEDVLKQTNKPIPSALQDEIEKARLKIMSATEQYESAKAGYKLIEGAKQDHQAAKEVVDKFRTAVQPTHVPYLFTIVGNEVRAAIAYGQEGGTITNAIIGEAEKAAISAGFSVKEVRHNERVCNVVYTKPEGATPNDVYAIVKGLREQQNPVLTTLQLKPRAQVLLE